MHIRILDEQDAALYQALRLRALQVNPEAFGSTYEREVQFSLETVVERIKPTKEKFVLGAFHDQDLLAGTVTFVRESGQKSAHKGNVFGMFVAEEGRGQGLGKLLMLELIRRAKLFEGVEQINLMVMSDNESAKKLYKSLGFEVYGVEYHALKYNGQYFDEDLMVLKL
ncbi:GNAT family N-acetyltransferase [Paenibacillus qinlingensis]|uniref:Ribosomal protein S18 acetylase RimI-like enzyme n=1 Tax=Paenibacillus qinlingensis TaxID=1837343 RepID=A0ABU1NR11_9BACL|nr:GNAT family N-acetyltransferase [Paenibacillus qinlingensis]MDR6549893.1 ribosomal protein S18 acetylase RimI-like enzyme [Paenibacillus qinlingensis]